jgi:hypothetical protein
MVVAGSWAWDRDRGRGRWWATTGIKAWYANAIDGF